MLETPDHALAPGAVPVAEVLGYGIWADTYHITSGPKDGEGAYRNMQLALGMVGLEARQAQYLNAHATSALMGDRGEVAAISRVFGDGAAVGAVFTVLSLRDRLFWES